METCNTNCVFESVSSNSLISVDFVGQFHAVQSILIQYKAISCCHFFSEAVPSCDAFQLVGSFEDTTGDSSIINGKSDEQCQYECLMKSEVRYIHLNI